MILVVSTIIGVVFGIYTARRRAGNRLDIAQYAAGYGIAFAILGLFFGILVEWIAA
ncbi:MAG: hypothetical protein ACR2O1_08555 [Boseongicola sp.]